VRREVGIRIWQGHRGSAWISCAVGLADSRCRFAPALPLPQPSGPRETQRRMSL